MKKILIPIIVFLISGLFSAGVNAETFQGNIAGRIFLQVENNGEAWYVSPVNLRRYYLGRPHDAFSVMREQGLGISNADYNAFKGTAPARLSGRILLKAQDKGQAFYVCPVNYKMYYLGSPSDAFEIMRKRGIGITNANLEKITAAISAAKVTATHQVASEKKDIGAMEGSQSSMEMECQDAINKYRQSVGMSELIWSDDVAIVAREHSKNMSLGTVAFGHDGSEDRFNSIGLKTNATSMAENVAYNYGYSDPVGKAVTGWLNSPGHKANIDGDFKYAGVGIAKNEKGYYYLTQIFTK